MRWYAWSGILLAAAASGLACWLFGYPAIPAGDESTTAGSPRPDRAGVEGVGYVEPASEVRKLTPRAGGVIRRCLVKAGDAVGKGDPLVELDSATRQAEVAVARKNLDLVEAEAAHVKSGVNPFQVRVAERGLDLLQERLRHAQAEADRSRNLAPTRATSAQEHEALETRLRQAALEVKEKHAELAHLERHVTPERRAVADAKVAHAGSALALAEERLRETVLVAPFDGVVLKVLKREGEGVPAFEPGPVLLFGDVSRLTVRAEVDERFVAAVAVGREAVVYGRNLGGKTYRGRVAVLESVMGDRTVFARTSSERKDLDVLQVVIDLGPEFRFPVGLQVDVRIEGPSSGGDGPSNPEGTAGRSRGR